MVLRYGMPNGRVTSKTECGRTSKFDSSQFSFCVFVTGLGVYMYSLLR